MSTVEEDIVTAKGGDLGPLLDRVKAGVVTQGQFDDHLYDPGNFGGDDTWDDIQDAHEEGTLTDEQFQQLSDALVAVTPEQYRASHGS